MRAWEAKEASIRGCRTRGGKGGKGSGEQKRTFALAVITEAGAAALGAEDAPPLVHAHPRQVCLVLFRLQPARTMRRWRRGGRRHKAGSFDSIALFALDWQAHQGRGWQRRQGSGCQSRHHPARHAHLHVAALLQRRRRRLELAEVVLGRRRHHMALELLLVVERLGPCLLQLALQAVGLDQPVLARVGAVALAAPPPPIVVLARPCSLAITAVVAPPLVHTHVCRALPAHPTHTVPGNEATRTRQPMRPPSTTRTAAGCADKSRRAPALC